jgi:phosphohistidine swiveling domain-containing protein
VAGRFPGQLAEELILPWAAGCSGLPGPAAACPPLPNGDSDEAVKQIVTLCSELTSAAWEKPAPEAAVEARAVLRRLRCGLDPDALDQLSALRPVSPRAAARVLALIIGLGAELRRRGCSPRASDIWRYPLTEVQRMLAGEPGHQYLRPAPARQWDGFLAEASLALGRRRGGTAAAPGMAVAAPLFAAERQEFRAPADRRVLVVRRPLPTFAPLLWGAAGLVSASGSPCAHLFDVARSLGVPAVTNCPLDSDLAKTARVVAVDGYGGAAFVLAAGGRRGAPLQRPERH